MKTFNPDQATMFPLPSFSSHFVAKKTQTASEGIARAEENASDGLKKKLYEILFNLCEDRLEVTSDDVRDILGEVDEGLDVLGHIFREAAKNKLLTRTNECKKSNRRGRIIPVWKSLIYSPKTK